MKRTVMFLMTGPAHAHYLAVALRTLRHQWSGDVIVFAWPESYELAYRLSRNSQIFARCFKVEPEYRGKNAQEFNKIQLVQALKDDTDSVVYLDADLIIQKPIHDIFSITEDQEDLTGVQFCDWSMNSIARKRVERMLGRDVDQESVRKALLPSSVSYNSGVFGALPTSKALELWKTWLWNVRDIFIAGETALHAVAQHTKINTILGGRFNCSPKFKPLYLPEDDVAIWHGHGDIFNRPEKCQKGMELWWPEFQEVLKLNIGNISKWYREVPNKFFQQVLKTNDPI